MARRAAVREEEEAPPVPSIAAAPEAPAAARPLAEPALKCVLVCSSGGHLLLLHRLQPWWGRQRRRLWVTFEAADAVSLLHGEEVVWAYHPVTRNLGNALRNLRLAWKVLRKERPDVVVSTGAGVAVPFFVAARLLRIRTVFIEAFERVDSPSLSGRLCYPISDLFVIQAPEQQRLYPRGVVVGRLW